MDFLSIILGTGILWGLKIFGTYPLAKYIQKNNPPPSSNSSPAVTVDDVDAIPLNFYILADIAVLGIGGFIISLITGWFFIGFSLKPRDWPGMAAFIIATLFGSGFFFNQ